jgi:hypothetical protein
MKVQHLFSFILELDVLIDRNVLQALHSFSAELKKKKNAASAAASNGGQSPQGIPEAKALNTTQQQPIPTTAAEIYGTTVGTTTTTMMMMMTTKATTTFAPRPSQPQPQCNSPPDFHPCVSLPEANQRLADCCRRKALPPGCLPLCRYDITQLEIKTAFERGHCGLFNILPVVLAWRFVLICCWYFDFRRSVSCKFLNYICKIIKLLRIFTLFTKNGEIFTKTMKFLPKKMKLF